MRDIGGPTKISNANATAIRNDLTVDTLFGLLRAERIRGSLGRRQRQRRRDRQRHRRQRPRPHELLLGVPQGGGRHGDGGQLERIDRRSGLRGACNDISLKTSFASIKLGLPASGGYNVNAKTSFGSITTGIPILTTQKSDNSLTGTIKGGGCKMTLVDNNGNIGIGRE